MRTVRSAATVWLVAGLLGGMSAAHAQELSPPSEVVLYIHSEMKRTEFVERLECALKHVLVAPVSMQDLKLALGRELLASPTQLDVQKVAGAFIQATVNEGGPGTLKYLFLPFDLKDMEHRYVFAASFTNARLRSRVGIMSTARLDTRNPDHPNEQNSAQTAHRLYKLVLESVARLAGLNSPDACFSCFRDLWRSSIESRRNFARTIEPPWSRQEF
jgi:hypothetical protein